MNTYRFTGLDDPEVYRDHSATRDFLITLGAGAIRTYEGLIRQDDYERARALLERLTEVYPEYWQAFDLAAAMYDKEGDTARAEALMNRQREKLEAFSAANPENLYYKTDLGMVTYELGRRHQDVAEIDRGIGMMWSAFREAPNIDINFRKLALVLSEQRRQAELVEAAELIGQYKRRRGDPLIQQILRTGDL
jgi:tetratricopeptide (TPR) repeat protein